MGYCCVPSCKSTQSKGVSFHKFPTCIESKRRWILAISQHGNPRGCHWSPKGRSTICSKHFKDSDYSISTTKKILLPRAVPSVFEDLVGQRRGRRKNSAIANREEFSTQFIDVKSCSEFPEAGDNSENEDDCSEVEDVNENDVPVDLEIPINSGEFQSNEIPKSLEEENTSATLQKEMPEMTKPTSNEETEETIDLSHQMQKPDSASMADDTSDVSVILSDEMSETGSYCSRSPSPIENVSRSTTIKISKNLQSVLRKLVTTIENQRAEISRLKKERDYLIQQVINLKGNQVEHEPICKNVN